MAVTRAAWVTGSSPSPSDRVAGALRLGQLKPRPVLGQPGDVMSAPLPFMRDPDEPLAVAEAPPLSNLKDHSDGKPTTSVNSAKAVPDRPRARLRPFKSRRAMRVQRRRPFVSGG